MSTCKYSPLPQGSIRLLRLLPNRDDEDPIRCRVFDFGLAKSKKGTHLYDALSYVWGQSEKPYLIHIDEDTLAVTANLHTALLHLRDPEFERVLWIDAICINQDDKLERGYQVQFMARIYGRADKVIVWLGESTDDSDLAIEELSSAANKGAFYEPKHGNTRHAVLRLMSRPWFRRIWVLQEAAAARRILIQCGHTEIDGMALCLGVGNIKMLFEGHPELQNLILSVQYLISNAQLRPRNIDWWSARESLDIGPLGQLLDMYHTHESTERYDKIYALLCMSSNNPFAFGLVPDYEIKWNALVEKLVQFVFPGNVSYQLWSSQQAVLITTKLRVIGKVAKSTNNDALYTQSLCITYNSNVMPRFIDTYQKKQIQHRPENWNQKGYYKESRSWHTRWTFPVSAKTIEPGDIVCLLEDSSKLSFIRKCENYFKALLIEANPIGEFEMYRNCPKWEEVVQRLDLSSHNAVVFWGWDELEDAPKKLPLDVADPRYLLPISGSAEDEGCITSEQQLLYSQLLMDSCMLEEAYEIIRKLANTKIGPSLEEENSRLLILEKYALLQRDTERYHEAITSYDHILESRKRFQDRAHPQVLENMSRLVSVYDLKLSGKEYPLSTEDGRQSQKLKKLVEIFGKTGYDRIMPEEEVIQIARYYDEEVMSVVLEIQGPKIITKKVVAAALQNRNFSLKVLELILSQLGSELVLSPEMVSIATQSDSLLVLLAQPELKIDNVKDVVYQAAESCNTAVVRRLIDLTDRACKPEVLLEAAATRIMEPEIFFYLLQEYPKSKITPRTLEYAAAKSDVIFQLLLERMQGVAISDRLLAAAARGSNTKNLDALLQRTTADRPLGERVWRVAALRDENIILLVQRNTGFIPDAALHVIMKKNAVDVLRYLLIKRRNEIKLTKQMVRTAAKYNSIDVLEVLFSRMGDQITVDKDLVLAAAKARTYSARKPYRALDFLFRHRGYDIRIDEDVLCAATATMNSISTILSQNIANLPISAKVLEAACRSNDAVKLLKILVPKAPFAVKISEKMLQDAIKNPASAPDGKGELPLIKCFHSSNRGGFKITKNVLKAAAGTRVPTILSIQKYVTSEEDLLGMLEDGEVLKEAVASGNATVVQFLVSKSQQVISQELALILVKYADLYKAINEQDYSVSRHILQAGIDFDLLAEWTPPNDILVTAARSGDYRTIKTLLASRPTNVNGRNTKGDTALHAAVRLPARYQKDKVTMINLLLCYGADPSLKDEKGLTPLGLALALDEEREWQPYETIIVLEAHEGDIIQPGYVDNPFSFHARTSRQSEISPSKEERLRRSRRFYLHRTKSADCLVAPKEISPHVPPADKASTDTNIE
jgi:hypothetical protein